MFLHTLVQGNAQRHSLSLQGVDSVTNISQKSNAMPQGKHTMSFNFPLFHLAIALSLYLAALYSSSFKLASFLTFNQFHLSATYKFDPPCGENKDRNSSFFLFCFLLLPCISETWWFTTTLQYHFKAAWHLSSDRPYLMNKIQFMKYTLWGVKTDKRKHLDIL